MPENHWTPGPWRIFIDDTGGETSGWPLSVGSVHDEDKSIVRPGGHYPYSWDAAMSKREAVANAHLISAAPDLYEALAELVSAVDGNYRELVTELCLPALAKARGEPHA